MTSGACESLKSEHTPSISEESNSWQSTRFEKKVRDGFVQSQPGFDLIAHKSGCLFYTPFAGNDNGVLR